MHSRRATTHDDSDTSNTHARLSRKQINNKTKASACCLPGSLHGLHHLISEMLSAADAAAAAEHVAIGNMLFCSVLVSYDRPSHSIARLILIKPSQAADEDCWTEQDCICSPDGIRPGIYAKRKTENSLER